MKPQKLEELVEKTHSFLNIGCGPKKYCTTTSNLEDADQIIEAFEKKFIKPYKGRGFPSDTPPYSIITSITGYKGKRKIQISILSK